MSASKGWDIKGSPDDARAWRTSPIPAPSPSRSKAVAKAGGAKCGGWRGPGSRPRPAAGAASGGVGERWSTVFGRDHHSRCVRGRLIRNGVGCVVRIPIDAEAHGAGDPAQRLVLHFGLDDDVAREQ